MSSATSSLQHLSSEECYELLPSKAFGRLGLFAEHYPLIIPVNYAMDAGIVVIRSRPGLKLSRAPFANVTFEVDDIDENTHSGWSVLVRGQAEAVTAEHSDAIIARTTLTALEPWVPGDDFHWIRIIPHGISGRRIVPGGDDDWRLGTAAYM